jgi:hypothetical protein
LQRLPRLGTSVWMILIFALFLIIMVPMVTGYLAQTAEQAAVQLQITQLQLQMDALKAKIASQSIPATGAIKAKADLEAAKAQYKNVNDNAEVSQVIMGLAWDYDITITSMGVSKSTSKVLGTEYPVLSYSLSLTGQVANFQNFLIAAGNKLPSGQFTDVTINPATVEGELDNASISMQVYCNE